MKPLLFKIQILLFFASLISSEETGIGQQKCEGPTCLGEGIVVETILKQNLNSGEKETVETPDLDLKEHDSKSTELPQTEQNVDLTEAILNSGPLLKESEVEIQGWDGEANPTQPQSVEKSESNDVGNTNIENNEGSQIEENQAQTVNPGYPGELNSQIVGNDQAYLEGQHGGYVHSNQEYHGHLNDHIGHSHSHGQANDHHGHSNGHFDHAHTHPGHSHDQGYGHHGHSQEQGVDHNVHSHDHGHSHGHSHDHGHSHGHPHGHGHSHDHGEAHDHSHGIGHLGRGVNKKVPEEIPQHYKPAAQNFDLPLSAQFGTPSPYNYQYNEPSVYSTESPPVYDDLNQYPNEQPEQPANEINKVQDGFLHENYEQVNNVQVNNVQESYGQETYGEHSYGQESFGQENHKQQEKNMEEMNANIDVEDSDDTVIPPETVQEQNEQISTNLYKDQNEAEIPQIDKISHEHYFNAQADISSPNYGKAHSSSFIPEWLHLMAHKNGGLNGDRIALVLIISVTILVIYLINTFMDQSTRERPLIRRLAEMDKKLFKTTNELLILKSEKTENGGSSVGTEANTEIIRELEMELEQARLELETSRGAVKKEGDRSNIANIRLEEAQQDVLNAQEEARQAQEMVEELLANQKDQNGGSDDKLMEVVHQLQSQLESQKDMLLKYEPKLKKKEKENKELTKQMKQMRADVANANLETDKLKKELSEISKIKEDSTRKLEEIGNNEDEWKSLSDLLQTQLEEKTEEFANMENEMTSLQSRLSVFKNESESKEEQMDILQETIKELRSRKLATEEEDGWEVEGEGWNDKEVDEIKDVAVLKVENRKIAEEKESLNNELCQLKQTFNETSAQLVEFKCEAESLREVRDEVVKEHNEVQRKLDVLTEFFNKKEAELQKQLGLQSARFGDASTDAESTARKLISVSSELESTQDQLKILKGELDDQERSLKASVAGQEKKAHENWVAARQAERKLTELQGEMSILRNRLTIVESKNTLLEQEKEDLEGTVTMLKNNVKPEPASDLRSSESVENLSKTTMETFASGLNSPTSPESLPPLPGLPGMPSAMSGMGLLTSPLAMAPSLFQAGTMLPGMLDIRPPPLGRMSPGPRDRNRSYTSRSPSPEYNSYRGSGKKGGRENRDASPSSRSERRLSPARRGPSPTRSDRGYRNSSHRQYEGDYGRDKDRHYKTRHRDYSPDRYSERSDYSRRESHKERQDRPEKK